MPTPSNSLSSSSKPDKGSVICACGRHKSIKFPLCSACAVKPLKVNLTEKSIKRNVVTAAFDSTIKSTTDLHDIPPSVGDEVTSLSKSVSTCICGATKGTMFEVCKSCAALSEVSKTTKTFDTDSFFYEGVQEWFAARSIEVSVANQNAVDFAIAHNYPVVVVERQVKPHAISALCRQKCYLDAGSASFPRRIRDASVLDYYGAARTKHFRPKRANPNEFIGTKKDHVRVSDVCNIEVVCAPDTAIQGDSGRYLFPTRVKMPIGRTFDLVFVNDVYQDGPSWQSQFSPANARALFPYSKSGCIYVVARIFEGEAGCDNLGEFPVEGVWVRNDGYISFSPDHESTPYCDHPDINWLSQRNVEGVDITFLNTYGPYRMYRLAAEFPLAQKLGPCHTELGEIRYLDIVDTHGSTRVLAHYPTVLSLRKLQNRFATGGPLDSASVAIAHIFSKSKMLSAILARFPAKYQEVLDGTVIASLYYGRISYLSTLHKLRQSHEEEEQVLLRVRASVPIADPISVINLEYSSSDSSLSKFLLRFKSLLHFLRKVFNALFDERFIQIVNRVLKLISAASAGDVVQLRAEHPKRFEAFVDYLESLFSKQFLSILQQHGSMLSSCGVYLILNQINPRICRAFDWLSRGIISQLLLKGLGFNQYVAVGLWAPMWEEAWKMAFPEYAWSFGYLELLMKIVAVRSGSETGLLLILRILSALPAVILHIVTVNMHEHGFHIPAVLTHIAFNCLTLIGNLDNCVALFAGFVEKFIASRWKPEILVLRSYSNMEKALHSLSRNSGARYITGTFAEVLCNYICGEHETEVSEAVVLPVDFVYPGLHTTSSQLPSPFRGRMDINIDNIDVTYSDAMYLLSEQPSSNVIYPILTTNGLLSMPSNTDDNLLASIALRNHADPFVGMRPQEELTAHWVEQTQWMIDNGFFAVICDPYPLKENAPLMGKSGQRALRGEKLDVDDGNNLYLEKSFMLKHNEVLSSRKSLGESEIGLKPRSICNLSVIDHARQSSDARAIDAALHAIWNENSCFDIEGHAWIIIYASGSNQEVKNRIGRLMFDRNNVIAVCGDDIMISCYDELAHDYYPLENGFAHFVEKDVSKMDASQHEGVLHDAHKLWTTAICASEEARLEYSTTCSANYAAYGKSVSIKGNCKCQQITGSTKTTCNNSCHACIAVVGCIRGMYKDPTTTFEIQAAKFGFTFTTFLSDNLSNCSFLKGWWQQSLDGSVIWWPLISSVVKLGKLMKAPEIVTMVKGSVGHPKIKYSRQESIYRVAYQISTSFGDIPLEYPILGPYLSKLRSLSLAYLGSEPSFIDISDNERYKTKCAGSIDISWIEDSIFERYEIDRNDLKRVHKLIDSVTELPMCILDPVFTKLANVDYGANFETPILNMKPEFVPAPRLVGIETNPGPNGNLKNNIMTHTYSYTKPGFHVIPGPGLPGHISANDLKDLAHFQRDPTGPGRNGGPRGVLKRMLPILPLAGAALAAGVKLVRDFNSGPTSVPSMKTTRVKAGNLRTAVRPTVPIEPPLTIPKKATARAVPQSDPISTPSEYKETSNAKSSTPLIRASKNKSNNNKNFSFKMPSKSKNKSKSKSKGSSGNHKSKNVAVASAYGGTHHSQGSQIKMDGNTCMFSRRSMWLSTFNGSTAFALAGTHVLNPGLSESFEWAAPIAKQYEFYEFQYLRYVFCTLTNTAKNGKIIMSPFYDVSAPPPTIDPTGARYLADATGAVSSSVWVPTATLSLKKKSMHPNGPKLVRQCAMSGDPQKYDCGIMYLGTNACTDTTAVGEVWIEYAIKFTGPISNPTQNLYSTLLSETNGAGAALTTGVTSDLVWNTFTASNNPLRILQPSTTCFKLPSGRYRIYISVPVDQSISSGTNTLGYSSTANNVSPTLKIRRTTIGAQPDSMQFDFLYTADGIADLYFPVTSGAGTITTIPGAGFQPPTIIFQVA